MMSEASNVAINLADQIDECREFSRSKRVNISEIASRFGITLKEARSRVQLTTVAPQIIALFRQGHIDLEQIEALSISSDFKAQEKVIFHALNDWAAEPDQIRLILSPVGIPENHRHVSFVGLDQYKAAGGFLQRDLFGEAGKGTVSDPSLLVQLASQKLNAVSAQVKAEGWKWVSTGSSPDAAWDIISYRSEHLNHADPLFGINIPAEWLAVSGALVGIDEKGTLRIQRGLVKPQDMEAAKQLASANENIPAAERIETPGAVVAPTVEAGQGATFVSAGAHSIPDEEPSQEADPVTGQDDSEVSPEAADPFTGDIVVETVLEPEDLAAALPVLAPELDGRQNYRIQPGEIKRQGSWKETAKRNIDIIELAKAITAEGREATDEEKSLLTKYTGWGASEIANGLFGVGYRHDWYQLIDRLKKLLTDEEYQEAKRTTQYAHYTSEAVISSIYKGMKRLGFTGGSILEPGMGIGLFNGLMPEDMAAASTYTGIEYDAVSASIARLLYPRSHIITGDYAKTALPRDFFDAAIGNPPFSSTKVLNDPEYKKQSFLLHDYFFAKTIDRVREGGIIVLITSKGTMDKKNDKARRYIAERADLLAAIRLPQTAFKENAGTQVVTDVIFLRKRMAGEKVRRTSMGAALYGTNDRGEAVGQPILHVHDWLETTEIEIEGYKFHVNEYFVAHPEMVLGRPSITGSMHRAVEYSVDPLADISIEDAFATAIQHLPEGVYYGRPKSSSVSSTPAAGPTIDLDPSNRKVGGLYLSEDGTVMQFENGIGQPLTQRFNSSGKAIELRPSELSWLKGYIRLRDALKKAQADQLNDGNWEFSLARLNEVYDTFVKTHGRILQYTVIERTGAYGTTTETKRFKNDPLIRIDAEGALAYALETIAEDGEIRRGPVLQGRVLKRDQEPAINTTQDALFVSLNRLGRLDIDDVARLAQLSRAEVIGDLGTSIYEDPAGGRWVMADEYLSGNVVHKLKEAMAACNLDTRYKRNVEALMEVQPKQLAATDIMVRLGANWVPTADIEAFAQEIIGDRMKVIYTQSLGAWTVTCHSHSVSEWSFDRMDSSEILQALLNSKQLKIVDRHEDGSSSVNVEATEKANDIATKMREAFQKWLWTDAERTERLVTYYNENFNNIAPRVFDGSHLTLPGLSLRFSPYAHQKRAVWRIIQQGDVYLAHSVGAGKAQPLDSKVLTPKGWVRMGDLRPGDQVIAGDGTPTLVEAVFPQGNKDIYRVKFSDGSETECCDEHLWLTQTYSERSLAGAARAKGKNWPSAEAKVRSLAEIRQTLVAAHLGAKNHSIPMVGSVHFDPVQTPIDPYLMGVLLGDGGMSGSSVMISSADKEILDSVAAVLPQDCILAHRSKYDYAVVYNGSKQYAAGGGLAKYHPLMNRLRELNLWGLKSQDKFIPDVYLYNSVEVRIGILQGLMDTDGWVSARGHSTYFTSSSPKLVDGVKHLVQSLGGTVSIKSKRPKYVHRGESREGRVTYGVCVKLPASIAPFRVSRKASLVKPKTSYGPTRYIVSIEPVGQKPAQCIRVAHPSHLYVTDDFIVTHNTFEMIAGSMEQKRLGLISKPMFVVPNHMLAQFSREFLEIYPAANILVADEYNFHTHNRRRFVAQAALNNPDAVIITHSAFGRIGMSNEFYKEFIGDQISEWEYLLQDVDNSDRRTRKQIERRIEALERRLEARLASDKKDQVLTFEELGVDFLNVDEAHTFRKLDFVTNQGSIKGIDPAGSQMALDLFMKVDYLRRSNKGRAIVMASGTAITNTMGELFTVQRFFQPAQLQADGLDTFDAWAAQYGDIVAGFEQNAAGGYEIVSRFAKFYNVPELMRRVRSFMDILSSKQLGELVERPLIEGGQRQIMVTPVPTGYREYQKELEARIKAIRNRNGAPKKGDDIILTVISDGRFSAIDMRFVDPNWPSDPDSKLNRMLDDAIAAYHETAEFEFFDPATKRPEPIKGATQIIFTDIGLGEQSAINRGFNMKAWMQQRLIEGGVRPEHIAFMRDHKQHAKKERLFAELREGKKRILIGGKDMETGVNVQKRLYDLFHLDAPWFPASVSQREGRIERQGNQNSSVRIRAYATKGSYDSTMWGMNARKARFIEQAMNGDDTIRSMDDVSEASAFQMAAALASGDERYMKVAGLRADIERLERLRQAHSSEQGKLRHERLWAEKTIEGSTTKVDVIKAAIKQRQPVLAGEFMGIVEGQTYEKREDFGNAVVKAVAQYVNRGLAGTRVIGNIAGFDLVFLGNKATNHSRYSADVYMDLPGDPDPIVEYPFSPDLAPGGIATRALNQVGGLERLLYQHEDNIVRSQRRIEQIKNRLGLPFPEEAMLLEKSAELNALESELAAEKAAEAQLEEAPAEESASEKDCPIQDGTEEVAFEAPLASSDLNQFEEPPSPANDDLSFTAMAVGYAS